MKKILRMIIAKFADKSIYIPILAGLSILACIYLVALAANVVTGRQAVEASGNAATSDTEKTTDITDANVEKNTQLTENTSESEGDTTDDTDEETENDAVTTETEKETETQKRVNPENAVYLTFDDEPSGAITPQILDILKENDVQATFFICDYKESDIPLLKRMIDEGHTIGIHGYSHDYSKIYISTEAFMNNINKLKDKLKEDTGYDAFVIRFPGGSSNTVSKKYCEGIMTELVEMVTDAGMMYLDWNVSSGDASGKNITKESIFSGVTENLKKGRANVVLMHDSSTKQTTADALQEIIDYVKDNGYSFYPVTEDTAPVHHRVFN